jgi:hypothetical protein
MWLICNRVIISLGKKGTIEQETNTPEYEEDNNNNISIPIDVDELSAFSEGEWAGCRIDKLLYVWHQ